MNLKNKKLLLLGGSSVSSAEIIEYAKSMGVYVIVADNQEINAGKRIADESWLISTQDIEKLAEISAEVGIDGVFAGVSEFNLECAMTICRRLGLPFYANEQHWDICKNKDKFKDYCRLNYVPTVREYALGELDKTEFGYDVQYPVVIKPTDGSAADGVCLCVNEKELREAYPKALSFSKAGKVLVEEYVTGMETVAYYAIKDGEMSLSSMADKYLCSEGKGSTPLPVAYVYPSRFLNRYVEQVDKAARRMFCQMGIKNGVLGIQGFYTGERFAFFEMGYRLGGTAQYRYTRILNRINSMEMMVNYSLTGKMCGYNLSLDNPYFNKCCCTFSLLSHEGKVAKVLGLDIVRALPGVIKIEQRYLEGDWVAKSGTVRQVTLRFNLVEETREKIVETMRYIQKVADVIDAEGKSMLFHPFNCHKLLE